MSNLQSSADKAQMIELLNSIKMPIMGAGGGFAPIGTENYFEGTTAPQGWILCDGSVLNIADYPELATYYASHYGASNHFGGDGVTTFAVPTKEGMPNNEDGIYGEQERVIGVWKETVDGVLKQKPVYEKSVDFTSSTPSSAFQIPNIDYLVNQTGFIATTTGNPANRLPIPWTSVKSSEDFKWYLSSGNMTLINIGISLNNIIKSNVKFYYTKTTDTWQLPTPGHSADGNGVFCVKATVAGDPNAHVYSTDEQIVGKDEYGNDVYEITLKGNVPANGTSIFSMVGKTFLEATGRVRYNAGGYVPIGWYFSSDNCIRINTQDSSDGLLIYWSGSLFENQPYRITVKYTKTTS